MIADRTYWHKDTKYATRLVVEDRDFQVLDGARIDTVREMLSNNVIRTKIELPESDRAYHSLQPIACALFKCLVMWSGLANVLPQDLTGHGEVNTGIPMSSADLG